MVNGKFMLGKGDEILHGKKLPVYGLQGILRLSLLLEMIGKKVEVNLRLFDIFQRKGFSFSNGEV